MEINHLRLQMSFCFLEQPLSWDLVFLRNFPFQTSVVFLTVHGADRTWTTGFLCFCLLCFFEMSSNAVDTMWSLRSAPTVDVYRQPIAGLRSFAVCYPLVLWTPPLVVVLCSLSQMPYLKSTGRVSLVMRATPSSCWTTTMTGPREARCGTLGRHVWPRCVCCWYFRYRQAIWLRLLGRHDDVACNGLPKLLNVTGVLAMYNVYLVCTVSRCALCCCAI